MSETVDGDVNGRLEAEITPRSHYPGIFILLVMAATGLRLAFIHTN